MRDELAPTSGLPLPLLLLKITMASTCAVGRIKKDEHAERF